MKMSSTDKIAMILVLVGGLNWGLIGIAQFDLVGTILGPMSMLSRLVYVLVGISAVYIAAMMIPKMKK